MSEPSIMQNVHVQVKFERAVFETPQLLTDKEFPLSVTVLGTSIDLTNLKVCLAMLFVLWTCMSCMSCMIYVRFYP